MIELLLQNWFFLTTFFSTQPNKTLKENSIVSYIIKKEQSSFQTLEGQSVGLAKFQRAAIEIFVKIGLTKSYTAIYIIYMFPKKKSNEE